MGTLLRREKRVGCVDGHDGIAGVTEGVTRTEFFFFLNWMRTEVATSILVFLGFSGIQILFFWYGKSISAKQI